MYVAITRAKERLYLTRSKSRYLYGKREPSARSKFLKELSLSGELDMPEEARRSAYGYGDGYGANQGGYGGRSSYGGGYGKSYGGNYGGGYGSTYGDDDPEAYGNAAYGANRYGGGGYNSSYGGYNSSYGRGNNSSYGSSYNSSYNSSYGGNYGNSTYGGVNGGSTYGGNYGAAKKPTGLGGLGKPKTASPTAPTKDLSVFKVGVQVSHPKFGNGRVVNVRGAGSNMILDVAFAGLGIKQLSAALAPLTVI